MWVRQARDLNLLRGGSCAHRSGVHPASDSQPCAIRFRRVFRHGNLPWPTPAAAVNEISWNRVHQIAMGPDRLSDNGGLYLPVISASVHHNEVYDVGFYNFAGLGVYAEVMSITCL